MFRGGTVTMDDASSFTQNEDGIMMTVYADMTCYGDITITTSAMSSAMQIGPGKAYAPTYNYPSIVRLSGSDADMTLSMAGATLANGYQSLLIEVDGAMVVSDGASLTATEGITINTPDADYPDKSG